MKFKVGDRVRIKTNLGAYESHECYVTKNMIDMEGKEHIIEEVGYVNHNCKISQSDGEYYWWFSEEMLEPVAPTLAEIKEKKLTCVIHTKTKREAIMLVKILGVDKERFYDENDFIECWDGHKENTCYRIRNGKVDQMDYVKFYQKINEEIYEFSDLFATGGVVSIHDLPTSEWYNPIRIDLPEFVFDAEQAKELAERLNKELAGRFNAFPNDGISAKNGGKNSMKFTFYVTEGYRIDKSNNTRIPTMTTEVLINGKDYQYGSSATCDKTDYSEREGVLNAIANAVCGGNFDREFNKVMKNKAFANKKSRTCTYCGQLFDTVAEKEAHEAWHVERRKARHERYLLRKRAKEIAFEEQAQKMAKEMIKEDK